MGDNRIQYKYLTIIGVFIGVVIGCENEHKAPNPAVLVTNEHTFAEAVARGGIRDGFLEYIADQSILFVPEAVDGVEYYTGSSRQSGLLTWKPIYAEIASGGDMGWTTGPWGYNRQTATETVSSHGHYVTIWKLQPDSNWKFVLDICISYIQSPVIGASPIMKVLSAVDGVENVDLEQSRLDLVEEERAMSAVSSSEGVVAAYLPRLASDVRFYRMGALPLDNIKQIEMAVNRLKAIWS